MLPSSPVSFVSFVPCSSARALSPNWRAGGRILTVPISAAELPRPPSLGVDLPPCFPLRSRSFPASGGGFIGSLPSLPGVPGFDGMSPVGNRRSLSLGSRGSQTPTPIARTKGTSTPKSTLGTPRSAIKYPKKKAAASVAKKGSGVARRLGVAADDYVYQVLLILIGALGQIFKFLWGVLILDILADYPLALFCPGPRYFDGSLEILDLDRLFVLEILGLVTFFLVTVFLLWKGILDFSRRPLKTKVPDELGYSLAFGFIAIALWCPRATGVLFGFYSLGALWRAGSHFDRWVCWHASVGHLGCMGRALWKGPLSLLVAAVVTTV